MPILQGVWIGFTAAATLGPIAVLIIQRILRSGWRFGAASGVGVALADGFYGLAGALGLSFLTVFLVEQQAILRLVGGGVLIYLGLRAIRTKVETLSEPEMLRDAPGGLLGAAGSIFLLTLTNPMTILFFSAVYAGITIGGGEGLSNIQSGAIGFAAGVSLGSLVWWLILSAGISFFRSRFNIEQLGWLNRVSGLVIVGFGVWVLVGMALS